MPTPKELIAETRALLAAADPGPWEVCPMGEYVMCEKGRHKCGGMVADTGKYDREAPPDTVARVRGHGRRAPQGANIQLIAAAPELLRQLVDALERTTD